MHTFVKVLVFYAFLFTQKLRATVLLATNAIFKPTTPNGSKPLFFTHICLPKNDEQQFYEQNMPFLNQQQIKIAN